MIKISACVIVKNEEKNLPRWFQGVKDIADEYIVVDTGSTDRTKEIAVQNGAKVFDFAWINDFSAAKNYAIEQAKGNWIIFLDADEYFHAKDFEMVRRKIKFYHKDKKVDVLMCKLDNIDLDNHNQSVGVIYQARIFRNKKYIRYKGAIHEALFNEKNNKTLIQYIDGVTIYHTGYSTSIAKKKAKRNLEIILERIAKEGIKSIDYTYLVDCYYALKDFEKVVYYARKFYETDCVVYGLGGKSYLYMIVSLAALGRDWQEINEAIEAAKKKYPKLVWLQLLEGISLYDHKFYLEAEEKLREAIENKKKQGDEITADLTVDFSQGFMSMAYLDMGRLLKRQKKISEALGYYIECLRLNRYEINSLNELLFMLKDVETSEVISLLNRIYSTEDAEFLYNGLSKNCKPQIRLYYMSKMKEKKISQVEQLLLADNVEMAGKFLVKELPSNYKLAVALLTSLSEQVEEREDLTAIMPKKLKEVWHSIVEDEGLTSEQKNIKKEVLSIRQIL